jgi:hypothetical protein
MDLQETTREDDCTQLAQDETQWQSLEYINELSGFKMVDNSLTTSAIN